VVTVINEQTRLTLGQVSRLLGRPYYSVEYAHKVGLVPEPQRIGNRRVYALEDIRQLAQHFGVTMRSLKPSEITDGENEEEGKP
jgi:DNA-binding transcriptional MerR regulator